MKILIPSICKHHPITSVCIYVFLWNVSFSLLTNQTYWDYWTVWWGLNLRPIRLSLEISRKNNGRLIRRDAGWWTPLNFGSLGSLLAQFNAKGVRTVWRSYPSFRLKGERAHFSSSRATTIRESFPFFGFILWQMI